MMTTSTALHLAARRTDTDTAPSPVPVLASRPRGVLHVVEVKHPGRRFAPPAAVPVCNRTTRRLHLVADLPSPRRVGYHQNGQRMCARCAARLAEGSEAPAGRALHIIKYAKTHRDELNSRPSGEVWAVEVDRRPVGAIVHASAGWYVHTAGVQVPVDRALVVPSSGGAIRVLAIARELAHLPGGPLEQVDGLTRVERNILDFAARVYGGTTLDGRRNGRRDHDITDLFGITPMAYEQLLNALVDRPEAAAYAPALVRTRRQRRTRKRWERNHPLTA